MGESTLPLLLFHQFVLSEPIHSTANSYGALTLMIQINCNYCNTVNREAESLDIALSRILSTISVFALFNVNISDDMVSLLFLF